VITAATAGEANAVAGWLGDGPPAVDIVLVGPARPVERLRERRLDRINWKIGATRSVTSYDGTESVRRRPVP
jgi:hypothetical protein